MIENLLKMVHSFKSLFSSNNQDWRTPQATYELLNKEFNFNFDPCPSNPTFNGLTVDWQERNFINPPYKDVAKWVR